MVRWSYSCLDGKYSLMTGLVFKQSLTREVHTSLMLSSTGGTFSILTPFHVEKSSSYKQICIYISNQTVLQMQIAHVSFY